MAKKAPAKNPEAFNGSEKGHLRQLVDIRRGGFN